VEAERICLQITECREAAGITLHPELIWSQKAALEQIGIPRRTVAEDGSELWNGDSVRSRLDLHRLSLTEDVMDT
jgi:hypothetical protein